MIEESNLIRALLRHLGEDPLREGLKETPSRVARFYEEFLNPLPFKLTTFVNEGTDELIIQTGIQFYSLCEHHMIPFFGTATVGYLPGERIVGLSKLSRLVQFHASGLKNQERITKQVADGLEILKPKAIGVLLRARHLCMEMRGVRTPGAETVTSELRGVLRDDPKARQEFLMLAGHVNT